MKQLQKIKRDNIVLGMRFSAPVFFDDGENMFLAENKPVLQYHIDALKKWNIPLLGTIPHIDIEELQKNKGGNE